MALWRIGRRFSARINQASQKHYPPAKVILVQGIPASTAGTTNHAVILSCMSVPGPLSGGWSRRWTAQAPPVMVKAGNRPSSGKRFTTVPSIRPRRRAFPVYRGDQAECLPGNPPASAISLLVGTVCQNFVVRHGEAHHWRCKIVTEVRTSAHGGQLGQTAVRSACCGLTAALNVWSGNHEQVYGYGGTVVTAIKANCFPGIGIIPLWSQSSASTSALPGHDHRQVAKYEVAAAVPALLRDFRLHITSLYDILLTGRQYRQPCASTPSPYLLPVSVMKYRGIGHESVVRRTYISIMAPWMNGIPAPAATKQCHVVRGEVG